MATVKNDNPGDWLGNKTTRQLLQDHKGEIIDLWYDKNRSLVDVMAEMEKKYDIPQR